MDKWLYRISIALTIIGLLDSIYMTIYKLTDNQAMCLGSGQCSAVNASSYAVIYGIPVAVFGILGYAAILATLWFENRYRFLQQNGTLMVFGMALTGFLFSLWLIYAEVFLIKALCPFCITSQAAMTLIFILSIIRLVRQPQN